MRSINYQLRDSYSAPRADVEQAPVREQEKDSRRRRLEAQARDKRRRWDS